MAPRERGRFCDACDKTVHDLSAMSAAEARALLDASDGSACVRYLHEPGGRVLHRDDAIGGRTLITMRDLLRKNWIAAASVAGVAMASVVLEACGGARARVEDRIHAQPEPVPDERAHAMDAGADDGDDATRGGETAR